MKYRTGIQQLDSTLSGGLPSGISEIFGEDSSGKSTLCFSVMREASLRGLPTSLIQSDGYPDAEYIKGCGVGNCVTVVPTHLESAFFAAHKLITSGVKVVVIDTLTNLECSLDYENLLVGERVKYAKSESVIGGLEILRELAKDRKALVIVVNQLRTPIGNLNPKPTSALHKIMGKLTSTRIQTFRESERNEYGELYYAKIRFLIKKSVKSPPRAEAWGFLFNERGFDPGFELLRHLLYTGKLESAGSYFRLPDGSTIGPGYEEAAKQINENLESWRVTHG